MKNAAQLFCVLLGLFCPVAGWSEHLTFCYDPYPPYTLGTSGAPTGGLKVEILTEVVDRIDGLTADIILLPWQRCQNAVREGQVDGILPLFENDQRREVMAFTVDVFQEQSVFWMNLQQFPEGIEWDGQLDAISKLRLGMLQGSYINAEMEQAFTEHRGITRGESVQALMLMLQHGRVDLVATDRSVGAYVVQELGLSDQITFVARPIAQKPSRFGLSKLTGADKYLEDFNAALQALHNEGVIGAIQNGGS